MEIDAYMLRVERNLILGKGRWVAEFNEAFRDFPVGSETFDLYVRGGTRPRGYLLSRLFAHFSLPDYSVAFFAKHVAQADIDLAGLRRAIEQRAAEHNVKWTWLVLVRTGGFSEDLKREVTRFDKPGLGISLVNLADQDIDTSSNALGRQALSFARIFK